MYDNNNLGLEMDTEKMREMKALLELAETARVNTRLDKLQTELDSVYRLVGKLYVSRHGDAAKAEFPDIVTTIDELERDISALRDGVKSDASAPEKRDKSSVPPTAAQNADDSFSAPPEVQTANDSAAPQFETPESAGNGSFYSPNEGFAFPGVTVPITADKAPDYDTIPATGFVNLDDVVPRTQPITPNGQPPEYNKPDDLRADDLKTEDPPILIPRTESIVQQPKEPQPNLTEIYTGNNEAYDEPEEVNENADYFNDDDDDDDDVSASAPESGDAKSDEPIKYPEKTVRCESCGAIITSGQNICTECGKEIDWSVYRDDDDHSDEEPTTLVKPESTPQPLYNSYAPNMPPQPVHGNIDDVGATVPVGGSPRLSETQPISFNDPYSDPFSFDQSFEQDPNYISPTVPTDPNHGFGGSAQYSSGAGFGGQQAPQFNHGSNYNAQVPSYGQSNNSGESDYLSNQGPTIALDRGSGVPFEQGQASPFEPQPNQTFGHGDNQGQPPYAQGASFDVGAEQTKVRYCPKCGHRIEGSHLFCTECGTKV